jgi:hypothetical protein
MQLTRSLTATAFNPSAYEVKNWFQKSAFKFTLRRSIAAALALAVVGLYTFKSVAP